MSRPAAAVLAAASMASACAAYGGYELVQSELIEVRSERCAVVQWPEGQTVLDLGDGYTGDPAGGRILGGDGDVLAEVGEVIEGDVFSGAQRDSPCGQGEVEVVFVRRLCGVPQGC